MATASIPEVSDEEILEAELEIRGDQVWGWRTLVACEPLIGRQTFWEMGASR